MSIRSQRYKCLLVILKNLKKSFLVLALLNSDSTLFTGNRDWFYIRKHTFCRSDLPLLVHRICKLSADPTPGHVINVRIAHCRENYLNPSSLFNGRHSVLLYFTIVNIQI